MCLTCAWEVLPLGECGFDLFLGSFLLAHDNVSPWPELRTHEHRVGRLPVAVAAQSMLVEHV